MSADSLVQSIVESWSARKLSNNLKPLQRVTSERPISRYKPPPVATRRLISCSQWESDLRNGYLTNNRDRSISAINQSDAPPFISRRPGKRCWKIAGSIYQAGLHRSCINHYLLASFSVGSVAQFGANGCMHHFL